MTDRLRIALAQTAPTATLAGNVAGLRDAWDRARGMGADLVLAPRFALAGWPCGDLPRRADVRAACEAALEDLATLTASGGPGLVLGGPWATDGRLHDALVLLEGGRIVARRARHAIRPGEPFDPGPAPGPVAFRGVRLGLMCGEDGEDPAAAETLAETGAELLLCLHADPFAIGRAARRVQEAVARVVETGLGFLHLNMVGGLDEAVCDGGSFALNPDRSLAVQLPRFAPGLVLTEWRRGEDGFTCAPQPLAPDCGAEEEIWRALVLFLRGFAGGDVQVAPTGDAGSALLAALAADALGLARVRASAPGLPLSPLDRTTALLGLGGAGGDVAPFRHLMRGKVLALARWRNANRPEGLLGPDEPVVAEPLLAARPAALAALPEDAALDPLLEALFDRGETPPGTNPAVLADLSRRLAAAEAARRRAPPGLQIHRYPAGRE
ncbi:MAG: NAD(+) synthase, partial [Roseomonas sp.]|nr:NAD(+) synthase [Roseomonas sp.]